MTTPEHPSLTRARELAHDSDSTAETAKGICRWLSSRYGTRYRRWLERLPKQTTKQYLKAERERTADPEAKRARHDVKFRKKYLLQLRRRELKAKRSTAHTLRGVTAWMDSFNARKSEVREIARLRAIIKRHGVAIPQLIAEAPGTLVIGFDADFARKRGVPNICMVGKEATLTATKKSSYGIHCEATPSTCDHRGRWSEYERATHSNYVRSFGIIDRKNPRLLHYAFHTTELRLELPEGYQWQEDSLGLKAVCGPDDFHVTAPILLGANAVGDIVRHLQDNANRRNLMKAQIAAEKAQMEGIWVCLADALRAGNCKAGCLVFAERHHISASKHYPAPVLLDMANGEAGRVRLAITAASIRHRKEMEQGFALLEEHQTN